MSQKTTNYLQTKLQSLQSHEAFQQRFCKQLDILLSAGLQIYPSLQSIEREEKQTQYKNLVRSILKDLEKGKSISFALQQNKHFFDDVFIELINVGEFSGKIPEIIHQLSTYFEQKNELRKSVISALTYPIIVVFISICSILVLLIVVVPNFEQMYAGFNAQLPGPTQVVIDLSVFLQSYGLLILLMPIILLVVLKQTPFYKALTTFGKRLVTRIPYFGELFINNLLIRFCLSSGLLLKNGIPLNQAIKQVIPLIAFDDMRNELKRLVVQLEKGIAFKQIMSHLKTFPPLVAQLMMAGDESATLAESLEYIGSIIQNEQRFKTQQMVSFIEPLLIVFLGISIGAIVIVLYLPIFELSNLY